MPVFNYTALAQTGKRSSGTIEAPNRDLALNKLREEGLVPLAVEEIREPSTVEDLVARFRQIPPQTLVIFIRQLATMIGAGIPPLRALVTLEEGEENPKFREIIGQMISRLEAGNPLYVAMAEHPETFSRLFVAMVRSGEEAGSLPEALRELASQLEKQSTLRRAIRSATIYPRVLLGVAFMVISVIMIFILPRFSKMFESFSNGEGKLPLPTRIIMGVSDFLYPTTEKNPMWFLGVFFRLAVAGAVIFGLIRLGKHILSQPGPRTWWDSFKLRAPMRVGPIVQKVVVARFSRTFASLLGSGVPAVEALEIVADTSGNVMVASAVIRAREQMLAGSTISEPLGESGAFPPMVIRMLEIGEETGQLEEMLNKIADYYEEEVALAIRGLTSVIEPLMIVMVGVLIGGIVISIYLPLLEIYKQIGQQGAALIPAFLLRRQIFSRWRL
mgnify:CR=1 FL=1